MTDGGIAACLGQAQSSIESAALPSGLPLARRMRPAQRVSLPPRAVLNLQAHRSVAWPFLLYFSVRCCSCVFIVRFLMFTVCSLCVHDLFTICSLVDQSSITL